MSVAKSLLWSFLEQGGSKVVGFAVQIGLARLLAPETFGVLAILLVIVNVADAMAQSGLGIALIQRTDSTDMDYSTGFWLSLIIAIVLYVALFFLAPICAVFYNMPDLESLLRVLSSVVVLNSINSIQRSYLQRSMNFKGLFQVNLIAMLMSGIFGILAALSGWGTWALVVQTVTQGACACAVMLVVVPWKPSFSFDPHVARELFSYGWKVCATGILNVLYSGVSELVIGKTCPASDLGYYSQGRKWPNAVIGVATNALQNVFFPAFSSIKDSRDVFVAAVKRSLVSGSFVTVPFALFFAAAADPAVDLLLGDVWLPCVPVFQMLCVSGSLTLLQVVNLRAYMALGNSGLYLKLQVVKVVVGGVAITVTSMISRDIYAVSFATMVVGLLSVLLIDLHPAARMIGYARSQQLLDLAPVYTLSAVAAAAAWFVLLAGLNSIVSIVIQVVVFLLVYAGGARLFRLAGAADFVHMAKKLTFRKRA
ncbi:lipopolysaccharide biosynthesis protein [Rubneribacter sp.]